MDDIDVHMSDDSEDEFEQLEFLSKEELLVKCQHLLSRNLKLERQISDLHITQAAKKTTKAKRKANRVRPIDFTKYGKKRVALKFLYLGWDYRGLASQDNTNNTIEEDLFSALIRSKLIEDRASSNYSRCGRTDKGVSAFGQVIALDLRSNFTKEDLKSGSTNKKELPYIRIINKALPIEIRVIAYAIVDSDFDARFACKSRTYKYFFPAANFDIQLMHEAAQRFRGEHDFRNFCKVDVGNNVNHFTRNVAYFHVKKLNESSTPNDVCELQVSGKAFLWHQVRCMASVLFLIGRHHEQPEIIDYLLDIEKCPKRPQYGMASEIPLVLYDVTYDNVEWTHDLEYNDQTIRQMQQLFTEKTLQISMMRTVIEDLSQHSIPAVDEHMGTISSILPAYGQGEYITLEDRLVCSSLDRHLEKQLAKRIKLQEKYALKMQSS